MKIFRVKCSSASDSYCDSPSYFILSDIIQHKPLIQHRMVWVFVAGACYEAGKPWAKAGYGVRFRSPSLTVGPGRRNCKGTFSGRQTVLEAELQAAIEAVKIAIRDGFSCLKIHTDSRQLFNGATCQMNKWTRNNWQTPNGEAVVSKEKWIELSDVMGQYPAEITWRFVRNVRTTGQKEANRLACEAASFDRYDRQSTNILQMARNHLRVNELLMEDIQRGLSVKDDIVELMKELADILDTVTKERLKALEAPDPADLIAKSCG